MTALVLAVGSPADLAFGMLALLVVGLLVVGIAVQLNELKHHEPMHVTSERVREGVRVEPPVGALPRASSGPSISGRW